MLGSGSSLTKEIMEDSTKPISDAKRKSLQKQVAKLKEDVKKAKGEKRKNKKLSARSYFASLATQKEEQELHQWFKKVIYEHYCKGNIRCMRCGIKDIDVLCIDHINDDGCKERKTLKTRDQFYKSIISRNFPPDYQILCFNCNYKKELSRKRKNKSRLALEPAPRGDVE